MTEVSSLLKTLKRPRLLVQAARAGQPDYDRKRMLARLLRVQDGAGSTQIALKLVSLEIEMEEKRVAKDASYSIPRHIEVLAAIMAEARLLANRAKVAPMHRQAKASATSPFLRAI